MRTPNTNATGCRDRTAGEQGSVGALRVWRQSLRYTRYCLRDAHESLALLEGTAARQADARGGETESRF